MPSSFRVDTSSLARMDKLQSEAASIQSRFGGVINRVLVSEAEKTKSKISQRIPKRSGKAASSETVVITGTQAEIGNEKDYYRYLREGTGIYGPKGTLIRPKNPTRNQKGKRAVFVFEKEGSTHFSAFNKGIPPRDFTLDISEEEIGQVFEDALVQDLEDSLST